MLKKTIVVVTLVASILYLSGCYTVRRVDRERGLVDPSKRISKIVTHEGFIAEFNTTGDLRPVVRDSVLVGEMLYGGVREIPLSDIKTVYIKHLDPVKTTLAVVAVSVGVILLAVAVMPDDEPAYTPPDTSSGYYSCPFVYSHDGAWYVLDGEPYGGAICEGLKRSDLCELEHLSAVGGEYRLMVSNELDETQYVDDIRLIAVDHAPGVRAVLDKEGGFHTVGSELKPMNVVDGRGQDQGLWLNKTDLLLWESDRLAKNPARASDLRDTLLLSFPLPVGASEAKLVVNACNTAWSSRMLKNISELWGGRGRAVVRSSRDSGVAGETEHCLREGGAKRASREGPGERGVGATGLDRGRGTSRD